MTLSELKTLLLERYEQSRGEKSEGIYTGERLLYFFQRHSLIYLDEFLFQTPITVDSKGKVKIDLSADETVNDDIVNELVTNDFLALTHSERGLYSLMLGEISVKNAIDRSKDGNFTEISMKDIEKDARAIRLRMIGLHRFNERKRLSDKIKRLHFKALFKKMNNGKQ